MRKIFIPLKKVIHHRKYLGSILQLTGDRAWLPLSPSLRELRATQGGCEVSSQCRRLVLWEWSGASPRPPSGPHLLPPYIIQTKGLCMIVLVSLIVLLRELLVSTIFRMVHPYIAIRMIFTLVYILQLYPGLNTPEYLCAKFYGLILSGWSRVEQEEDEEFSLL